MRRLQTESTECTIAADVHSLGRYYPQMFGRQLPTFLLVFAFLPLKLPDS